MAAGSFTGSETYGVFGGGFSILLGNIFFGPSADITTLEGSDPSFTANLGVIF